MDRRKLFKLAFACLGFLAVPVKGLAGLLPATSKLGMSQLVAISWPAAVESLLGGKNFHDYRLLAAEREGRVHVRALGPVVEHKGAKYDVQQLSIPCVWTAKQEHEPNANKKISCTAQLIQNALDLHDHELFEAMGDGQLIVSQQYRHSRGETSYLPGLGIYQMIVYAAYVVVPKD